MTRLAKLFALSVAIFGASVTLGSSFANAAACNGTWARAGATIEKQCYYLPTVSNGRVTGLEYQANVRQLPQQPGAVIGGGGGGWHPAGGYHHK